MRKKRACYVQRAGERESETETRFREPDTQDVTVGLQPSPISTTATAGLAPWRAGNPPWLPRTGGRRMRRGREGGRE